MFGFGNDFHRLSHRIKGNLIRSSLSQEESDIEPQILSLTATSSYCLLDGNLISENCKLI